MASHIFLRNKITFDVIDAYGIKNKAKLHIVLLDISLPKMVYFLFGGTATRLLLMLDKMTVIESENEAVSIARSGLHCEICLGFV